MSQRLVFVALVVAVAACAHPKPGEAGCALAAGDSTYLSRGLVFRDCAVDKRAKLLTTSTYPDFQLTRPPSGGGACYIAEAEFVIDAKGVPEGETARVVIQNDQAFADAVLLTVSMLRFQPAIKDGTPVRQIGRYQQRAAVMLAPAGQRPSGRPPIC